MSPGNEDSNSVYLFILIFAEQLMTRQKRFFKTCKNLIQIMICALLMFWYRMMFCFEECWKVQTYRSKSASIMLIVIGCGGKRTNPLWVCDIQMKVLSCCFSVHILIINGQNSNAETDEQC